MTEKTVSRGTASAVAGVPARPSRRVGLFAVSLVLALIVWTGRMDAASAAPLRAVEDGFLAMSPGGGLEERLTLHRDLIGTLLRVPVEGKLRLEEWPVSPGVRETVTLTRHDVYAPGAKIVKIVPEGEVEIPHSSLVFFWGSDDGGASRIVVSIDPEARSLRGMAISEAGVMELTPAAAPSSRRYRVAVPDAEAAGVPPPSWSCGEEALPPAPPAPRSDSAPLARPESLVSFTRSAVIAVDTDNELMLQKFSDDTTAAANYIASLFAQMNVIYERDVSLHMLQGYTILRVSTVADPYAQSGTGNADGNKLDEFSSYWSAHYPNIKRTLAAMLSGKQGSSNSASGIAWIGGLCSSGFGYSFSQVFKISFLTGDTQIVGHEIGHNFGSPHTHCYSPPADFCYNAEGGCYSGATSCPAPTTINGVTNVHGTLMSYCHLLSGCSVSLVFHPRTLSEYFNSNITGASSCIFNVGTLPPGPTVTGINPPTGSTSGGTSVTISGNNFSANPAVAFSDKTGSVALTVGTATATSITATAPAHGAGAMDVVVMNSDFQTGTLVNGYTYIPPPVLSSVSPTFGSVGGGTLATLSGSGFQASSTVLFGGLAGTSVTFVNSGMITARTPAHTAGTVSVAVTNADLQSSTLPNSFTYNSGVRFFTVTPCRVIDTRNATGAYGGPALAAGADRTFVLAGQCGIPSGARSVAVNVAVTQPTAGPGFLTLFQGGTARPQAAMINYSVGQTRANNEILPLGAAGDIVVHCGQSTGTVQMILDVNGYFQ